jgi:hypothetical protein
MGNLKPKIQEFFEGWWALRTPQPSKNSWILGSVVSCSSRHVLDKDKAIQGNGYVLENSIGIYASFKKCHGLLDKTLQNLYFL